MVADNPTQKIDLKAFHCEIQNDHMVLKKESKSYRPLPVIREVNNSIVQQNYLQIKQDVEDIVESEIERMMGDPALEHRVVRK
jgi:hypothetical protein